MKKIYVTLLLILPILTNAQVAGSLIVSSSLKDSVGGISKEERALRTIAKASIARKQEFLSLKKSFDVFPNEKNIAVFNPNEISQLENENNATFYPSLVSRLDKKYTEMLQVYEKDNIPDVQQFDKMGAIRKQLARVQSAACMNNQKDGQFFQSKDMDGEEIIGFPLENLRDNPRYGLIENYREGFARIKKDQVFGFLNLCGEEVVPAQYELAEPFNNGKALVKKFTWFFVDAAGNESDILEDVVEAHPLNYGVSVAKFKNNKYALIDNKYDVTKKPISYYFDAIDLLDNNLFKVRNGKLFGLMKIDGTIKIEVIYDRLTLAESKEWVIVETNKKVGLIDVEGETRIKPAYESINIFSVDPSLSLDGNFVLARNLSGVRLFDLKNRRISETYTNIGSFNAFGLSSVQLGKKVGLMNSEMKVIVEPLYSSISNFNQFGLAAACKEVSEGSNKCGYIRYDGVELIPLNYSEVSPFSKYGFVAATEKIVSGEKNEITTLSDVIYDKEGRIVINKIDPTTATAVRYSITDTVFSARYVVVRTTTKTGSNDEIGYNLLDKNQFKRITPMSFNSMRRMDVTTFSVLKDAKWGLMDTSGKMMVKPTFKEIKFGNENLFGVKFDNDKYGFVDKKGKVQVSFEYNDIEPFNNGYAIVNKGANKIGLINRFNAKVVPCVFSSIKYDDIAQNYELVDKSANRVVLDKQGNCTQNCQKFNDVLKKANQEDKK